MKIYLIKSEIFYPIYKKYLEMRVFHRRVGDMVEVKPANKSIDKLVKKLFNIN